MSKPNETTPEQQQFMQNIAERLGRKQITEAPEHPFRGAPGFWKEYNLSADERINLFMKNWRMVGGQAERFNDLEGVKLFISNTAAEMGAQHFIRHDQKELNALNLEEALPKAEFTVWGSGDNETMKVKAAGADIGIVVADYAVAVTGSLVLASNESKGRTVSLLPTAVMLIVPADAVKTRMGEVMEQLSLMNTSAKSAGIHFISGPSRSADIENDLTIGVHGPGIVYALIVG
jgi:L-lactate dehydrogenase complex protein LldG